MDDAGPKVLLFSLDIFQEIPKENIPTVIALFVAMLLCLVISAICAASENAFFSHKDNDLEELESKKDRQSIAILKLLSKPKHLLATILLLNSLVIVAFVILSKVFYENILNNEKYPWLEFFIDTILVTLIILIFGEVMPKVYATQNYRKSARFLVVPMSAFYWILLPFTSILEKIGEFLEKNAKKSTPELTPEELSQAIDLTTDEDDAKQEKEILKGIVNMGNIQVKQIMVSRLDIIALDIEDDFEAVLKLAREMGYSRMPVYKENLDQIVGVLNVKNLLPHLNENKDFNWQSLIFPPFFIPENKAIDDLLQELRHKHAHIAIVVDEFGGTSGMVTLEDVLEEVFGELNDEFDEQTPDYIKVNGFTYIYEGKTLIVDFLRETGLPVSLFDSHEMESDSLAGLITEFVGRIPKKGDNITIENVQFIVEAADPRKVKKIKVILPQ